MYLQMGSLPGNLDADAVLFTSVKCAPNFILNAFPGAGTAGRQVWVNTGLSLREIAPISHFCPKLRPPVERSATPRVEFWHRSTAFLVHSLFVDWQMCNPAVNLRFITYNLYQFRRGAMEGPLP